MGKYNFDKPVDRKGTSCLKYDFAMERMGRDDLLPLWVADMDFPLPEEILEDLHSRIAHGIFGYTNPDEEYFSALNHWFSSRHGYSIDKSTVSLSSGVVYGIATGVRAFTEPGDAVLIQQPVYYPFKEIIEKNGRICISSDLCYNGIRYSIDMQDFEQKLIKNKIKAFILCSPHNPVGRVWSRDELMDMAELCHKHGVVMLSDEIHCDFMMPGQHFTSMMTLPDKCRELLVLYTSPSKSFNIAGLQIANVIIENRELMKKYRAANAASGYSQGSALGQSALKACYLKGSEWLDELNLYIYENMTYMDAFLKEQLPKARLIMPEGTYLAWVDFSGFGLSGRELDSLIISKAGLWLDSGSMFGPQSEQFQRFNVACPRSVLENAMSGLRSAFCEIS